MTQARIRMSYPIYPILPDLLDECKSLKTSKTEYIVPYLSFYPCSSKYIKSNMLPQLSFYPCCSIQI